MSENSPSPAVELRGVSKRYGKVAAVDDISFTIPSGTLTTFLGPSGCGKTTTLRLIAGLELASSGTLLIAGRDVTRLSATDRDVGMVFQSYALFPHMTVLENVMYGLAVGKLSKAQQKEKAQGALELVGLEGFDQRLPSELSGGQQQRVAVARALVIEPQVLLFDEPLSNLDAKLRRRMRDDIREIQLKLGITGVYVTHDQEEAMAVSDTIVVMDKGRIAQAGPPDELYRAPVDRFVADFIGGANLIDCDVAAVSDGRAEVRLQGLSLQLPARGLKAGPASLAVRYSAVNLLPSGTAGGVAATVRKSTYLGDHFEYTLDTPMGELFVIDHELGKPHRSGAGVVVGFREHGLALVAR